MKLLKTTFSILSTIVYICIAIYLVIAAPLLFKYRPVVVLSGSMEPTYHVGSIVYYKQTPFEQIEKGDSITFRVGDDGTLVTHRVTEKDDSTKQFITRGDANQSDDPSPVEYGNVAGVASKITIPYAGYFITIGKNYAVIGIMALVLIISLVLDNISGSKKKKEPDSL